MSQQPAKYASSAATFAGTRAASPSAAPPMPLQTNNADEQDKQRQRKILMGRINSRSSERQPFAEWDRRMGMSMPETRSSERQPFAEWARRIGMSMPETRSTKKLPFAEWARRMGMSMPETRSPVDPVVRPDLQKCLDRLYRSTREVLVNSIKSLSHQLGLKFIETTSCLFISSDMFYLEIVLHENGMVTDVKVHHKCKIEQSCSELVECLNNRDFADFTAQLKGLTSIYQLNADPKAKTKAFVVLQAMETDLLALYHAQDLKNVNQIDESVVGIVTKRRGGHAMKLTYFVSPYHLMSLDKQEALTPSTELLNRQNIGLHVSVNLEAASKNRLQVQPTVSFTENSQTDGKSVPVYGPLTSTNSILLPATYVLRLNKPLPVCSVSLRALLCAATSSSSSDNCLSSSATTSEARPATSSLSASATGAAPIAKCSLMEMVVQAALGQEGSWHAYKGLFVQQPDQTHCYYVMDKQNLKATLVSSIPYTEVAQVPHILAFLKKHALFYTLLSSCIDPQNNASTEADANFVMDVHLHSFELITVSLVHSYKESMATIYFQLKDSTVTCNLVISGDYSNNYSNDYRRTQQLTNIVRKTHSIPITVRTLLYYWEDGHRCQIALGTTIGQNDGSNIEIIPLEAQSPASKGNATVGAGTVSAGSISSSVANTAIPGAAPTVASTSLKNDKRAASPLIPGATVAPSEIAAVDTGGKIKRERKHKNNRDDSSMGSPEKISRQNSPVTNTVDSSETIARAKFPSPSSSTNGYSRGLVSASSGSSLPTSTPSKHSPKHGSSEKPSMSTLISATAYLSPESDKSGSSISYTGFSSTTSSASFMATGIFSATSIASKCQEKDSAPCSIISSMTTAIAGKSNPCGISAQKIKSPSLLSTMNVSPGSSNDSGVFVTGASVATTSTTIDSMRKSTADEASLIMSSTTVPTTTMGISLPPQVHIHGLTDASSSHQMTTSSEYIVKQNQEDGGPPSKKNRISSPAHSSPSSGVVSSTGSGGSSENLQGFTENIPTEFQIPKLSQYETPPTTTSTTTVNMMPLAQKEMLVAQQTSETKHKTLILPPDAFSVPSTLTNTALLAPLLALLLILYRAVVAQL